MQVSLRILCTRILLNNVTFWIRLSTDSFVFFLGMAILCCLESEILMMPNPFETEKTFEPLYGISKPPHDFNMNPILGDAYEALLLSHQASYLLQSSTLQRMNLATVLLRKINCLLRVSTNNYIHLAIYYCTKIVLPKIIHRTILVEDKQIHASREQLLCSLQIPRRMK